MNEKVDLWIHSTKLAKGVIEVLAIFEGKSLPTKFEH